MLQVLVAISQKFCCRKETWGYEKFFIKKRKKVFRKNRHKSVRDIKNNGHLDARLKKRKE